jgi:hypothetical protein
MTENTVQNLSQTKKKTERKEKRKTDRPGLQSTTSGVNPTKF